MLRDYVDEDLDAVERERVDAHVHTCRSCALALSRTESEDMVIRSAVSEVARARPPVGFSAGVMAEVSGLAEVRPPVGLHPARDVAGPGRGVVRGDG